jgi:hypothetical protein
VVSGGPAGELPFRDERGWALERVTADPAWEALAERLPSGSGPSVDWPGLWRRIGLDGDPPEDLVRLGSEVGAGRLVARTGDLAWSGIDVAFLDEDGVIDVLACWSSVRDLDLHLDGHEDDDTSERPDGDAAERAEDDVAEPSDDDTAPAPSDWEWPAAPALGGLVPFAQLGDDGAVWSLRTGPDPAVVATEPGEESAWSPGSVSGFLLDVLGGRVPAFCGIAPEDGLRLVRFVPAGEEDAEERDSEGRLVGELGLPEDEVGSPYVGPWVQAVRDARRVAEDVLDAHAEHVVVAWSDGHDMGLPLAEPTVIVGRVWWASWAPAWFAAEGTRLEDLVHRPPLRGPRLRRYEHGARHLEPLVDAQTTEGRLPWAWLAALMDHGPFEFEDAEEERDVRAERAAAEALLHALVGAINRLTEERAEDRVVVLVDEHDRVAAAIDRWWPADVRPRERKRLT